MKSTILIKLSCVVFYCHFQSFVCGSNGDLVTKLEQILQGVRIDKERSSVPIDPDHLQSNPECGILPPKTRNAPASSRIANAEEADQHYPWMILLVHVNEHIENGRIYECGGSIITQTIAVSAAHCICGSPDFRNIPPHLLQYTECVGGDHKKFNPPNEIRTRRKSQRNYNELTAHVGDKDKTQTTPIHIFVAYVMSDTRHDRSKKETRFGIAYDVGLVMTKDQSGNGIQFYLHTTPVDYHIKVGSVCLAAKKDDDPFVYDGYVVSVGWGIRYSDVKRPNGKPESNLHSCTTNRFGPSFATFRHCNVNYIFSNPDDKKCQRQSRPVGYDSEKCDRYLKEAEKAIERKLSTIPDDSLQRTLSLTWKLTNRFEILASREGSCIGPSTGIKRICYKQKLFEDYGWCYLDDGKGNENTNEWGFCDTSCDLVGKPRTEPQIYHEMVWQFPTHFPFRCDIDKHDPANFKPWYICIVYKPPQTSVFQFKKTGRRKLKYCDADKYDPIRAGYQLPCKGDSGSGHFMKNSEGNKWALVALTSYDYGQFCGTESHLMTTVHPDVLSWIKEHSKIGIDETEVV